MLKNVLLSIAVSSITACAVILSGRVGDEKQTYEYSVIRDDDYECASRLVNASYYGWELAAITRDSPGKCTMYLRINRKYLPKD